jgi:hypothetical protein
MFVYTYDEKGFFLQKYKCQESPLEKGVFLKPINSTEKEPPEVLEKQKAKMSEGEWVVVLDDETEIPTETPTIEDQRKLEYIKEGVTVEAMTVALWEKIVENKPQAMNDLQAKREAVKIKLPKA